MNKICISIDGLHCGMLGAYGNGWIQTPEWDRLACQSLLFDRYYCNSMELDRIFDALWAADSKGSNLMESHTERGWESVLITDDSDVYLHGAASDFTERLLIEPLSMEEPVEEPEETRFYQAMAELVDQMESRTDQPTLYWLHLRAFRGPWDFPFSFREKHRAEDDPEPYGEVLTPSFSSNENEPLDPDCIQAVMETYSGGILLLDNALAGLVDYLDEKDAKKEDTLILLGTRGFSLGEHRRIGEDTALYGENLQVPLLVRLPEYRSATVRISGLLNHHDFGAFLKEEPSETIITELMEEKTDSGHQELQVEHPDGSQAKILSEWFMKKNPDGKIELYVKPDDRWEVNDVADRCPEVLQEW